eukprot:8757-Pyramimonas_sp.AAC.1
MSQSSGPLGKMFQEISTANAMSSIFASMQGMEEDSASQSAPHPRPPYRRSGHRSRSRRRRRRRHRHRRRR